MRLLFSFTQGIVELFSQAKHSYHFTCMCMWDNAQSRFRVGICSTVELFALFASRLFVKYLVQSTPCELNPC